MKEKNNIALLNIKNLTSLWGSAVTSKGRLFKTDDFSYAKVNGSDWPNRLWFHNQITEELVQTIKNQVLLEVPNLTIPCWDIYENDSLEIIESNGFQLKFQQTAMYLKPKTEYKKEDGFLLKKVTTKTEAKFWTEIFKRAFGYEINASILPTTFNNINYYIAHSEHKVVGTAMTNQTENTLGIHSVGVLPEMRRNGFAEKIMKSLLNLALSQKYEYVTLQSSDMGKGLYQKLGFKEQFIIKNYILK